LAFNVVSKKTRSLVAAALFLLLLDGLCVHKVHGQEPADTMLMFVGEDLETLSIASRKEESAWQAPAIADVITRRELRERGMSTVSDALEMLPGFHMAKKEGGTQPYLRGIPDSVLFLYDTIPMASDITKSVQPVDHELSLAPVKRIEIIRGPGSVLWGPDAFAGIVNTVPMTGKDLNGVEAGLIYGSPGQEKGGFANMGYDAGQWDAFLSVSGRKMEQEEKSYDLVSFWGDGQTPVSPSERYGQGELEQSRYLELVGNCSLRDWLSVSGRISDYKRPYTISGPDAEITWPETKSAPFSFIKLEARKKLDSSSLLRFTGFYNNINIESEVIDKTLEQNEETSYGELIYDRSFMAGQGLLTGGLSYRVKDVEDAPIWESYLPDYLGPDNENFLPIITVEDYDARLWSVFAQYTHKFGDIDVWLGARNDWHDEYEDHMSYNAGLSWFPSSAWIVKLLYGTAYRTPFAKQLLEENEPDLEQIRSLNAQIAWRPSKKASLSVSGFTSHLKNHIKEDPYAGLSEPNNQEINGLEFEGELTPIRNLDLSANLTLLGNRGSEETYHYIKYYEPGPNGTLVPVYEDLGYPYDTGPTSLLNLTAKWRSAEGVTISSRLGYFSSRELIYPKATEYPSCPGVWLFDMGTNIRDILYTGLDLEIAIRNLFNKEYNTPGTYTTIEGDPLMVILTLRKRW
jgi:outer membrane receptor for ferrienterochelin and colicin